MHIETAGEELQQSGFIAEELLLFMTILTDGSYKPADQKRIQDYGHRIEQFEQEHPQGEDPRSRKKNCYKNGVFLEDRIENGEKFIFH